MTPAKWATNMTVRNNSTLLTRTHKHLQQQASSNTYTNANAPRCTCTKKKPLLNAHTAVCTARARTARSSRGFRVQRMFYFGNSFGLVTLLWWQTEKQVANIKHFTSTVTHANTHPRAHKHTHASSQSHSPRTVAFPPSLSLSLSLFQETSRQRENVLFKTYRLTSPSLAANVWSQLFWQLSQKH